MELAPVSEVILDEASIGRFRTRYRAMFGAAGNDDPLYEAVSAGRKHQGYEHWLPFFHERLETIFDYLPASPVLLDEQTAAARGARWAALAEQYDALVMVDDSHAVGVVGPGGRGTPEHYDAIDRVDIVTGTLGKAIGGASGGYVAGRREIVELLRQRARPYLFSNSLAPSVAAASLRALELIETSHELRDRLRENTTWFRSRMGELGFEILPGEHPIAPVMIDQV